MLGRDTQPDVVGVGEVLKEPVGDTHSCTRLAFEALSENGMFREGLERGLPRERLSRLVRSECDDRQHEVVRRAVCNGQAANAIGRRRPQLRRSLPRCIAEVVRLDAATWIARPRERPA